MAHISRGSKYHDHGGLGTKDYSPNCFFSGLRAPIYVFGPLGVVI